MDIIKVFILAMTPIGELRAALPVALQHYKLGLPLAFAVSIIGNLVPVVAIVFLLNPVQRFLSRHSRLFAIFFEKLFARTRRKHSRRFERFEEMALISFVAIPLPVTGAWTGALASFVFGIPPRKAIPLIALGVTIAAVVVTLLTLGISGVWARVL
ncbi:MAG: small multi-drug export protein [Thermoleophilia bacterium]|nr:small multi-drug export protein [Thermoleophilia bacterium]